MNSEQKRIILAVLLSGMVLFGWQTFFAPPMIVENLEQQESTNTTGNTYSGTTASVTPTLKSDKNIVETIADPNLTQVKLENEGFSFNLGSSLTVNDAHNPNQKFNFKNIIGEQKLPAQVRIIKDGLSIPVSFSLNQISNKLVKGTNSKYGIDLRAELLNNGMLDIKLNSTKAYRYQVIIKSELKELENRQIRQYAILSTDVDRTNVTDTDEGDGSVKWFGIDFNFHLFAFVFEEKVLTRYKLTEDGHLNLDTVKAHNHFNFSFVFTLKNYDQLKKLNNNLDLAVDFGIFGIVAIPILRGLQYIYGYVPNYGFSIILLTLFIRFLMFPLQYKSSKSMKKMQKIQPEMKAIREKYKDKPQKMQQETMALMKSAGANPIGGCLPVILQMPILFAFYQVLYNAVELVGAPFAFWITDLSIKDPYFVLPVLMGIAMYFQTKVTPQTTTDPTQQKVMAFMPLIFCFFMKDLPAGLNLYIFVSTVFGVVQQLIVFKYTD